MKVEEEKKAGSKGSSSIKQSKHTAAAKSCGARFVARRRRSGPLDVVLPETDVLVDKVAQRSVHGLHAPHVKLPRRWWRRRAAAAVPLAAAEAEYIAVVHEKNLPAAAPRYSAW